MGNVNLENLMAVVKSGKSGKDSYPSPTVAALGMCVFAMRAR